MLRDPREVEREVDELRAEMQRVLALSDDEMPANDRRDRVMQITGRVESLEVQARELREHEIEQVRAAALAGHPVGGPDAHAERMDAFRAFLRSGDVRAAALETATDANGGYLMPDPARAAIVEAVRASNPIMADATLFTLSKPGTFKVELPRKTGVTNGGWVGEKDARPATNAPTFGMQTLECFEWYAYPEATQSSLDAIEDAEQLILDDIAETYTEIGGIAFATGDGSGKPTGVFSSAAQSYYTPKLSSTADALDAAQIINAYMALPGKFLPVAKFYGNGATLGVLSALAWPNLNNTPLVRWEGGKPTIMGKDYVIVDNAPAIGNGAFPVAFGDMKRGYAVGVHSRMTTLRDAYTNKPYVGFYTTGRTGGVPWDPKALLLLKSDNA